MLSKNAKSMFTQLKILVLVIKVVSKVKLINKKCTEKNTVLKRYILLNKKYKSPSMRGFFSGYE